MKTTVTKAFLYRWTHLPTQKWYVGSRTAKGCHPGDRYICSSKTVKPMILENRNEWVREILAIGKPSYIIQLEARYLQLLNARADSQSFNLHNGDGKFNMTGRVGFWAGKTPWNKGLKGQQVAWNKGLTGLSEVLGSFGAANAQFGKPSWNKGLKGQQVAWNKGLPPECQPFTGRTHSAETKEKLSQQKIGDKNPAYGKAPWNKGLTGSKQSEETKAKRAVSMQKFKGVPRSEEVKAKISATKRAKANKSE